jgi:dTMP kinase
LDKGKVVICDRFHDSTAVYQGVARKLEPAMVNAVNSYAIGAVLPDVTFLLDMEAEQAFRRLEGRSLDRMESEPISFYEAVRDGYLKQASRSDGRIVVIDASKSEDEIASKIREIFILRFPDFATNLSDR